MGFGEVKFIDLCVTAEWAPNKRKIRFQEAILGQTFVEFANDVFPTLFFVTGTKYEFLGYATLAIIGHGC